MNPLELSRRSLLTALGIGGAGALAGCGDEIEVWPDDRNEPAADWPGLGAESATAFGLGVASGEPRVDGILLWTRYDGMSTVKAHVFGWDGATWTEIGVYDAEIADGGFIHLPLTGLLADQPLAFQFVDGEGVFSAVGHARTAIAANASRTVRFGAISCLSYSGAPFESMVHAAARGSMDFFIWNGDTVYCDNAATIADYRALWTRSMITEGFQAILGHTAGLWTWDDHEVTNDFGIAPVSPEREAIGRGRLFEHAAILRNPEAPDRIWRQYAFGQTVDVFVLDSRGEHDVEAGLYLSSEQFEWLTAGLLASTATWKVIVNSVPIAQMPEAYGFGDLIYEHWDGYPTQRAALLAHILDNGIDGVLFVSGDMHQCTLARVDKDGPSANLLDFLVGPGGSTLNPLGRLIEDGEQYIWSDADWNTTRFDLRPDGIGRATWVRNSGETLCEAWFDTHGSVLKLDYIPLG